MSSCSGRSIASRKHRRVLAGMPLLMVAMSHLALVAQANAASARNPPTLAAVQSEIPKHIPFRTSKRAIDVGSSAERSRIEVLLDKFHHTSAAPISTSPFKLCGLLCGPDSKSDTESSRTRREIAFELLRASVRARSFQK